MVSEAQTDEQILKNSLHHSAIVLTYEKYAQTTPLEDGVSS
jgi:hypothetical protein